MQRLVYKVAPLAVMTVCTIWCCWSQLRDPTPLLAATEAKLPRIERKLLHPELSSVSERDPFLQYKPELAPVIEEAVAEVQVEEEPRFDPRILLPSFRLDATMPGARPLAVINGKIHSAGESIVVDAAPEVPCRLQRVLSYGIVMEIGEETFLIRYSNASREDSAPASGTDQADPSSDGIENELPEGIPNADELEQAVADSLAQQPQPADGPIDPSPDQQDDSATHATDEECEFEQDLLNTNKFDELLNNYED